MGDESKQPSNQQSEDALQAALHDLHTALDGAEDLDAEDREDLVTAIEEIREKLGDSEEAQEDDSIGGRMLAAIERFEDRHPDLTKIMGRIADSLSEMGI